MKALVETDGDFMLFNATTLEVVESHRPSIIAEGYFLQAQLGLGHIRVLQTGLPEETTDAEWAEWLKASDDNVELAVASFLARFSEPEEVKEDEPLPPQGGDAPAKGKAKAKAKAE